MNKSECEPVRLTVIPVPFKKWTTCSGITGRLAPAYAHLSWGDGNGHRQARAALTIPFVDGSQTLGTWHQIIYVDFDTRPRRRELVVQVIGK